MILKNAQIGFEHSDLPSKARSQRVTATKSPSRVPTVPDRASPPGWRGFQPQTSVTNPDKSRARAGSQIAPSQSSGSLCQLPIFRISCLDERLCQLPTCVTSEDFGKVFIILNWLLVRVMTKLNEYVKMAEATHIIGVAKRFTAIGYCLFRRQDLVVFLAQIKSGHFAASEL